MEQVDVARRSDDPVVVATTDDCSPLQTFSQAEIDDLREIFAARCSQQCNEALWNTLQRFDADAFAAGEVDLKIRHRVVFYAMRGSARGRQFYLEHMQHRNPLFRLLEQAEGPLIWSEWQAARKLGAAEKAALELVRQHGWVDGFAAPVLRHGNHIGLISVICKTQLNAAAKAFLSCAAFAYLERIRATIRPDEYPVAPMGLAPRELECLELVANGLSDRRIALRLKISVATAHEHVQRAMRRIGVTSRAEAVAIATAFGVIRL